MRATEQVLSLKPPHCIGSLTEQLSVSQRPPEYVGKHVQRQVLLSQVPLLKQK
jgi:hypothetical protein